MLRYFSKFVFFFNKRAENRARKCSNRKPLTSSLVWTTRNCKRFMIEYKNILKFIKRSMSRKDIGKIGLQIFTILIFKRE